MQINKIQYFRINKTKKTFMVYIEENNKLDRFLFTEDLYRYRQKFGIKTKFILTDILKKQININL